MQYTRSVVLTVVSIASVQAVITH